MKQSFKWESWENANKSLRYQLESNFKYMKEELQQRRELESELTVFTTDVARLATLNDSLTRSLQQATQINWRDSITYYNNVLTLARNQLVLQQKVIREERVKHQQAVDSLSTQIVSLVAEKKKLENIEQINLQRIRQIELREDQLKRYELKLTEREQIISQKESVIEDKLADLARKEKKYQGLLDREKELDLREQRIKIKGG